MRRLNICGQRLANQHLITQTLDKPSEVVRLLGAVQAQDNPFAKWGLARSRRSSIIELKVHGSLTGAEHRAVGKEVKRFGAFLGMPTKLGKADYRALPGT